jgi:FkbM family methyltransferase
MLRMSNVDDLIRLGSASCGWWVPERILRPGAIAYCAGAGLDISFDLHLHSRGLTVVTIDPTPRSVAYVGGVQPDDDRFHFLPLGLWNERDELSFYAPSDLSDISHSVLNLQRTQQFFTAPVDSLAGCMARMHHDHVDLLKVDIEGAESTVLPYMLANGPYPEVVCFEYDQPQSILWLRKLLRQFEGKGYQLVCRERWNFTLLLTRARR